MARTQTWEVSDELWEKVEPLIPKNPRNPDKQYKRAPGAGRKPRYSNRLYFSAIVYVLRTGIIWNALPREKFEGITSQAVHKKFMIWARAGFFPDIWKAGLFEYDELRGIDWEWQSADGTMSKAPLAREAVGPNPTDRGKNGSKRSLLVDGNGVPLSIVVTGANRHDCMVLGELLRKRVSPRPNEGGSVPVQNLCLDAGYTGKAEIVAKNGMIPHIRPRGEEKKMIELEGFKPRRWIVEVAHSWFNRFRKILVRFEKTRVAYEGLVFLAAAMITLNKVINVYPVM